MATTQNRTFFGGSTVPGSGVYPEDVKLLKVFANYAETDYDPLASSDTSVYIPTVDKHSHDDGNIVSIIDRVLAAGGSPIVTKHDAEFTYSSGNASEYKFVNVSGDNITEMTINRTTGTVTTQNNFLARPVEVEYGVSTASDVASIINAKGLPYMKVGELIARLYKIEPSKYTFRTTNLRADGDINYLDIVDYIVNGSTWTTVMKTVSSGETGTAYLKKVSSPTSFDTTGLSGLQTVAGVNDVPNDGVYQVSVMLSVTPKTAKATKSDLVFGFYGADGIGMADRTFHAVVDDSQIFAQQLSFSTTLNLKAGANSLKLSCDRLNTNYLVFVDELTLAQLVNGVYHNGNDFEEVNDLLPADSFNEGDNFLVVSPTSKRKMSYEVLIELISQYVFSGNKFYVTENNEYSYAIIDSNNSFLFGIKKDGSVEWSKGIPEPIKKILDVVVARLDVQEVLVGNKVDKEQGKSLINSIFASCVFVTDNSEYIYAINDSNGVFLFGIKKDGSVEWSKGLPKWLDSRITNLEESKEAKVPGKSLVNKVFADGVNVVSNKEFILAFVDENNSFLFGIKKDGSVEWSKGLPQSIQAIVYEIQNALEEKQDKISNKTVIDTQTSNHCESTSDNDEWFWCALDAANKIIEGIKQTGEHVFMLPVNLNGGVNWSKENLDDLTAALKENGFAGGTGDWSDSSSLEIPIPSIAIINFTNIDQMPQTKTTDAHAIMEFWDMNGNYFKKKVIANAQGSSSLSAPKKNISIDLCNDEWVGDDTFKIKFGGWVPQDSFHIKAYYTDFFRCVGLSGYDLVKKILDTRVPNTTWKKALNYGTDPIGQKSVSPQIDSGALCYPQGFLCKVYLNGVFEGLFCWQLKKHRDNYHMNKKTAENIHIEGMLGGVFFGGSIDWTAFEIRNPKDLITYTGTKYDGDNPTELIDSTSPAYDPANSKHKLSAKVKQYIINLSNRMAQIGNDPSIFEQYFDVDSCVDYAILSDTLYNYDYVKNVQWTTWDGVKWFVNPYDLDCTLGANSAGDGIHYPTTSHIITATNHPLTFAVNHYTSELEQRWKELRDAHIIDPRTVAENLEHYVRLFGDGGYKSEYDKWTNAPCNRDPIFDTDNWELERDADGNPVIYTTQYHAWSSSMTYAPGYVVQYNLTESSIGNFGWWFRFTAKQTNIDKPPITQRGFKDNIFRVYNWLSMQIANMDTLYNYT